MSIIRAVPDDIGWSPIQRMIDLLAFYVGSQPHEVNPRRSLSRTTQIRSLVAPRVSRDGAVLVIASDPGQLLSLAQRDVGAHRFARRFAWVIDSFWDERIPFAVRHRKFYDHIFVTDPADVDDWLERGVPSVSCLPWGADVLSLTGRDWPPKNVDVQRVGRQPSAWDNDQLTARTAEKQGIAFQGRTFGTEAAPSPRSSWLASSEALSVAKGVLAFSVRDSGTNYTHPTKDYLTGRWTDALAHGCTVLGSRPQSAAANQLLWPGSTVEIDAVNLEVGLAQTAEWLSSWSPEVASNHQKMALERLDWRHRFGEILTCMELRSPRLEADLAGLSQHTQSNQVEE